MSSRSSKPGCASLYVRNVPDGARIDELKSIFGKYGIVSDVYIPLDYYTRRPRGFAYIQFDDPRDAEDALYNVHHLRYYGVELEVEFARSDRKTPSTMRAKDRDRGYSPPRGRRDDDDYDRRRRDRSYSRSPDRYRRYDSRDRSRSRSGYRHKDSGSSRRRSRSRSYSPRRR